MNGDCHCSLHSSLNTKISIVEASVIIFILHAQTAREQWAETLWSNLNINLLQEGIETFLKLLRKLPRDVRMLPVGRMLDDRMKEFKDSLPLFVDLKHEALRER